MTDAFAPMTPSSLTNEPPCVLSPPHISRREAEKRTPTNFRQLPPRTNHYLQLDLAVDRWTDVRACPNGPTPSFHPLSTLISLVLVFSNELPSPIAGRGRTIATDLHDARSDLRVTGKAHSDHLECEEEETRLSVYHLDSLYDLKRGMICFQLHLRRQRA